MSEGAGVTSDLSLVVQLEQEGLEMVRIPRLVRLGAVAAVAAALMVACGGDDENGLTVRSQVVSDTTTQDIQLLTPETQGNWPVVLALHGMSGKGEDMVELGTRLAHAGAVVFAPSYNTDITTTEGLARTSDDLVCSYQLARRTATEHGGDLTQPFTVVGWSLGADLAMLGGLQGSGENTSTRCPGDVPRPDVVVGLSGCYYEFEGTPVTWFDDVSTWGNKSAHIYLTDGDRDDVCPAWQTEKFATALRAAGYQVDVVQLHDANHFAPVFHDLRGDQWQVITDDPAGDQAVKTILDAMTGAGANLTRG